MNEPEEFTEPLSNLKKTIDSATERRRRARVAVIEDDAAMREMLEAALRAINCDVFQFTNGFDAFTIPTGEDPSASRPEIDVIISDVRMPGCTGLEFLEYVASLNWSVPVIIITAFGDEETHREARRLGAVSVYDKPFDVDQLVDEVRRLLELPRG